jgi:hypothetical protein
MLFRGTLPGTEPLLRCVGHRRIPTHERAFGIAKLRRAVAPGHHLRRMHHFHLFFQPRELGFHVIDLELDDSSAIGGGLSASIFELSIGVEGGTGIGVQSGL